MMFASLNSGFSNFFFHSSFVAIKCLIELSEIDICIFSKSHIAISTVLRSVHDARSIAIVAGSHGTYGRHGLKRGLNVRAFNRSNYFKAGPVGVLLRLRIIPWRLFRGGFALEVLGQLSEISGKVDSCKEQSKEPVTQQARTSTYYAVIDQGGIHVLTQTRIENRKEDGRGDICPN